MQIDPTSYLPLHAQVEEALRSSISDGVLSPGSRLPAEDHLVARYAVSRTTIRTAIQSLVARGLVEIRRGKGTFVTQPTITQELTKLSGFLEDMQALGREASARGLDWRVVAGGETGARPLSCERGATVARIQRVRLAALIPLSFEEPYLPQELGEK